MSYNATLASIWGEYHGYYQDQNGGNIVNRAGQAWARSWEDFYLRYRYSLIEKPNCG